MKHYKKLLEIIAVFLLLALTGTVLAGVIGRIMDISVTWYDEVASFLLVWLTYYGSAYIMLARQHMSFDGLLIQLPTFIKPVIFALSELVVFSFFVIMGIYGWKILEVFAEETLVSLSFVSLSFTQSVIPIASVLFIISQILSIKDAWNRIASGVTEDERYIQETISNTQSIKKES